MLFSPFAVIGILKGRYALSLIGMFVLLGIPTLLAAARIAAPDSLWAKWFYDDDKVAEARERYASTNVFTRALTL